MMAIAAAAAFGFSSCTGFDDDDNGYDKLNPNALVTVRSTGGDGFYLQLTDDEVVYASNVSKHPFGGKTVRAFCNIDRQEGNKVYVNWIDSVLTKQPVAHLGEEDANRYGNDPVEIVNSCQTVAEDGFLTIRFRTQWGGYGRKHEVNLVTGIDPEDPYKVVFHHNANGDYGSNVGDGYVAFDLSSLPDTGDEPVKLTLVWRSFTGEKTAQFDFRSHNGKFDILDE